MVKNGRNLCGRFLCLALPLARNRPSVLVETRDYGGRLDIDGSGDHPALASNKQSQELVVVDHFLCFYTLHNRRRLRDLGRVPNTFLILRWDRKKNANRPTTKRLCFYFPRIPPAVYQRPPTCPATANIRTNQPLPGRLGRSARRRASATCRSCAVRRRPRGRSARFASRRF